MSTTNIEGFEVEEFERRSSDNEEEREEPATPSPNTKKKGKGKEKKNNSEAEEETSLYYLISKGSSLKAWQKDWIKKYTSDKKEGLVEIINFIIECCGFQKRIKVGHLKKKIEDVMEKEIISDEDLRKFETTAYPIVLKKNRLKEKIAEGWRKFIETLQEKLIFDNFLIRHLISWLSVLSQMKTRPFRHTSTLLGLNTISGLTKIAQRIATKETDASRQARSNRSSHILSSQEKFSQQREKLEEMMNTIFKNIFQYRYRDVFADMRADCISALGSWIEAYPSYFLQDEFLKYIGWLLFDKEASVRLASLNTTQRLYDPKLGIDFFAQLITFTQRFKPRMLEMARDVSIEVSTKAIQVLTLLGGWSSLEQEEAKLVCDSICDDNASVRLQTAKFVNQFVVNSVTVTPKKTGEEQEKAAAQLKALLNFIENSPIPDLPNYVIDSLWMENCPILRNWDVMTDLLGSGSLSDNETLLLSKFINACAKKGKGDPICPKTKTEPSKSDKAAIKKQTQETFTRHFVPLLPELLQQFQASPAVLQELVELAQCFDVSLYSDTRQKKARQELLTQLHQLFLKNTQEELLETIAHTLRFFQTQSESKGEAETEISTLKDDLIDQFQSALSEEASQDNEANLYVYLTRILKIIKVLYVPQLHDEIISSLGILFSMKNSNILITTLEITFYLNFWNIVKQTSLESREASFYENAETVFSLNDFEIKKKSFFIISQFMIISSVAIPESLVTKIENFLFDALAIGIHEKKEDFVEDLLNCIVPLLLEKKLPLSSLGPKILIYYLDVSNFARELMKQILKTPEIITLFFTALTMKFETIKEELTVIEETKKQEELIKSFTELGHRFSTFLNFRAKDMEQDIADCMNKSIQYILPEGEEHEINSVYLSYFDGIYYFINKLAPVDATTIFETLISRIPKEFEDNQSYIKFKEHLEKRKSAEASPKKKSTKKRKTTSSKKSPAKEGAETLESPKKTAPKKKGKKRSRKEAESTESDEVSKVIEEIEEEEEEQPLVKKPRRQSVAMKEPAVPPQQRMSSHKRKLSSIVEDIEDSSIEEEENDEEDEEKMKAKVIEKLLGSSDDEEERKEKSSKKGEQKKPSKKQKKK